MYVLALNVKRSYGKYSKILQSLPFLESARDFFLYECVRSAWGVKKQYAESVDFVVAVYKEKIIGVYKAYAWLNGGESEYLIEPIRPRNNRRLEFVGRIVENDTLLDKCVPYDWFVKKSYVYLKQNEDLTLSPIDEKNVPIK